MRRSTLLYYDTPDTNEERAQFQKIDTERNYMILKNQPMVNR
jgi:hypothetical protein